MRAVVTGATGFIGTRLLEHLASAGWDAAGRVEPRSSASVANVESVSPGRAPLGSDGRGRRRPKPSTARRPFFIWPANRLPAAVGPKHAKQRIRDSRVTGTRNLVAGLERLAARPAVLVSGSAVGYYGPRGDETLTESASPGHDFLAEVCVAWEEAALAARSLGIRVALSRTGVALGNGGALAKMLLPFKLGVGGPLAGGRQWMPWIHVDDLAGAVVCSPRRRESLVGPYNAVAPQPVTNREFTRALAQQLHRPAFIPTPYFALRLAFGEMASMLVGSQRAVPQAAEQAGYQFRYPDIDATLADILGTKKRG